MLLQGKSIVITTQFVYNWVSIGCKMEFWKKKRKQNVADFWVCYILLVIYFLLPFYFGVFILPFKKISINKNKQIYFFYIFPLFFYIDILIFPTDSEDWGAIYCLRKLKYLLIFLFTHQNNWNSQSVDYIRSGTSIPRRAMPFLRVLATFLAMTRRVSFSSSVSAPRML